MDTRRSHSVSLSTQVYEWVPNELITLCRLASYPEKEVDSETLLFGSFYRNWRQAALARWATRHNKDTFESCLGKMQPGIQLFLFVSFSSPVYAGHLTGCGGADLHNLPTSASSASLGHFSAQN